VVGSEPAPGGQESRLFDTVQSRLLPPRRRSDLVDRRRLVTAFGGRAQPVVLVSAPAGYGKTIALTQWLDADSRPASWLLLRADDDDRVVLLTYLALALQKVAPVDDEVLELLRLAVPPVEERVLPALGDALAAAPPFLLVLEDGERMTQPASWKVVEFLADSLPEGAQLALASRTDPPLPLARWRAAGSLAEFRTAQLAFDDVEARELLARHDAAADDRTVDCLLDATGGWPTALYLKALAARDAAPGEVRDRLCNDEREVEQYFVSEVLDQQSPDLQEFLLRSSVLERLEPGPLQVVTGRDDAPDVLLGLERTNLFVASGDEPHPTFRYQRLFADLLLSELARRHPDEDRRLHALVAEWFRDHDDPEQAIQHYLAAGQVRAAADIVAATWPRLWRRGQQETARRWLAWFSDEQIREYPPLTLTAGWVFSAGIDVALGERWALAACSVRAGDDPSPDGAVSLRSSQLLLRATLALDGITQMRADAERAVRLELARGTSWYAEAHMILGVARWLSGARRRAVRPLERAASEGMIFNQSAELAALGTLGLVAMDDGDWARAAEHVARARFRLNELGFGTMRRSLPILYADARLAAHDGRQVGELTAEIGLVMEQMVPHPWLTLVGCVVLGEACVECGDHAAARRWSALADEVLEGYPDAGILRGRIERLSQALERAAHGQSLTPAERRVLDLLPTHLSEARIAAELCVSQNTVKTHLRGVYRKLGAGNRAEAVERAHELGLLRHQEH